jgi:hypothetical protein
MTFKKINTVERMILDAVARRGDAEPWVLRGAPGYGESSVVRPAPTGITCLPSTPTPGSDVMVEPWVRRRSST